MLQCSDLGVLEVDVYKRQLLGIWVMIKFENVTKYYGDNVGLENVSIAIDKGDFVFLVGPSGAGKSTFIKLILKEINACPVSYTHLDVYKRQLIACPTHFFHQSRHF